MKWNDKLNYWHKLQNFIYPKNIKKSFFYETSPIKTGEEEYKVKFIENKYLDEMVQDYSSFMDKIKKSKNNYVTSFYNLSGDTLLVIPIPKQNKNFTTIKHFIDNASKTQKKYFWKYVSQKIKSLIKNKKTKYWISTHGTGVPYFHLRISTKPKYYLTKSFMN